MFFQGLDNPHNSESKTKELFKNDLEKLLLMLYDKRLAKASKSYLNPNSEEFKGEIYLKSTPKGYFVTAHINLEEFGFENNNDFPIRNGVFIFLRRSTQRFFEYYSNCIENMLKSNLIYLKS